MLKRNFIIISIFISVLVLSSYYYTKGTEKKFVEKLVFEHAQNIFDKDISFRRWIASHGGVYVPITETTPPNKYLSHIKNRDIDTVVGKLTLMNPAYSLRQFMGAYPGLYGEKRKITSLKLMNPINAPDEWEIDTLKKFEKGEKQKEFFEITDTKEGKSLRYMKALRAEKPCLKCHAAQGYKLGDLRGGISVMVPLKRFYDDMDITLEKLFYQHIIVWLIIMLILFGFYIKMKQHYLIEKEQEEESKRKDEMLHQQSKMAAMGEMIENIAHQWRQPLSVISTAATGIKMEKEYGLSSEEREIETLVKINDAAQHLSKTIDDFRDFFRPDKEKELISLYKTYKKTVDLLQSKFKNRFIDVVENIDDVELYTVEGELMQVIMNILNNARDVLETMERNKRRFIFIDIYKEDQYAILKIKDNGGGIPENIIDKIFEPYFTTKHQSQGTGIGLYMSMTMIKKHMNGDIKVKNEEYEYDGIKYKGACFTLKMPIEQKEKES